MVGGDARQAKPAGHSGSSALPAAHGRAGQAAAVPGIILCSRMKEGAAGQSKDRGRNMREGETREEREEDEPCCPHRQTDGQILFPIPALMEFCKYHGISLNGRKP